MSFYVRQNRYGFGDTMAASFNAGAMRQLVQGQRDAIMAAVRSGTGVSDPTLFDPGYGAFEPAPGSSSGVPTWAYYAGAGVVVLLGVAVAVKMKRRRA
jgi:hypothetical protein